jgi:CDP-diacylglycerol---glycerol-3-phosphate 3-phosphatidyltransferase
MAPNALSLARVALVPLFVVLLLSDLEHGDTLAAIVFAIASATDTLDGWIARARDDVTTFGKFLDPLADKLLVSCALIALVELDRLAAWVAMVIVAREFAVTGLRLAAASSEVIAASWLGKGKTIAQMVAIFVLCLDAGPSWLQDTLVGLAVVLTLLSAVDYFARSWRHLRPY